MKNLVFKVLVFAGIVTILTGCPGSFTYGDTIVLQNRSSSCIRCYETSLNKEYKNRIKTRRFIFHLNRVYLKYREEVFLLIIRLPIQWKKFVKVYHAIH